MILFTTISHFTVLASGSQCKGINAPSLMSPAVAQGRMKPVGDFLWFGSVH